MGILSQFGIKSDLLETKAVAVVKTGIAVGRVLDLNHIGNGKGSSRVAFRVIKIEDAVDIFQVITG